MATAEIIPPEGGRAARRLSDEASCTGLLGKVDDALQLNPISDFLIGSDGFGTRKCWDEESTVFTACTDYSACTGTRKGWDDESTVFTACTDSTASTGTRKGWDDESTVFTAPTVNTAPAGTRKGWEDESTVFTACTDSTASTDNTSCTDNTASTGFSAYTGNSADSDSSSDSSSCFDGDGYNNDGSSTGAGDTRLRTVNSLLASDPSPRHIVLSDGTLHVFGSTPNEPSKGDLEETFNREQFSEHCASGKRPLRFVPVSDILSIEVAPLPDEELDIKDSPPAESEIPTSATKLVTVKESRTHELRKDDDVVKVVKKSRSTRGGLPPRDDAVANVKKSRTRGLKKERKKTSTFMS